MSIEQPRRHGIRQTILILIIFGIGVVFGRFWEARSFLHRENVAITDVVNVYGKSRSSSVDFEQFWDIWKTVKEAYVEQPVDDVKLFYGALEGMVHGLGDPYSMYFPPTQAQEFASSLAGEFDGIGAEIGYEGEEMVIISPLPNSPAEKAGLRAGDRILKINNEETFRMSLGDAVTKIRGKGGTTVNLTLLRPGEKQLRDVVIVRATITIPSVEFSLKKNNTVAYIRLNQFNDDTWPEFDSAVKEAVRKGVKGVVLDLRGNPGGYLETAIQVTSEWVKTGVIVREKNGKGEEVIHESVGSHRFVGMPTVVLVDSGSASGSEIVAGALKDYGVAKIMGEKTFGKGSVQDFAPLPDASALKITIARWYTPNNNGIDKTGIEPDEVIVDMYTDPTYPTSTARYGEEKRDKGLDVALQSLK